MSRKRQCHSVLTPLFCPLTPLFCPLLDWTGRQIRKDKPGSIPAECAPMLERLQCSAETWLVFVNNFLQRFRNEAGLAASRQAYRNRRRSSPPASQAS